MFRKSNDAISAIVILVYALLFLFCTEVNEGNMAYLKWTPINFAYNTEIVLFFALIFVFLSRSVSFNDAGRNYDYPAFVQPIVFYI